MKRVVLFASAIALAAAIVPAGRASAAPEERHWGSETIPQAGVCFYQDKNFKGPYFCLPAGESAPKLPPGMNDKISSFRLFGGVDVLIFREDKFKGQSGRYFTDVRDLRHGGWDDNISSVHVDKPAFVWNGERFPVWGRDNRPEEGACFYKDANFGGDYFCIPRGASYREVPMGFNNQISSIRLMHASGVMLATDDDFEGRVVRLTADVPDLARGVWNDRVSSIRVF